MTQEEYEREQQEMEELVRRINALIAENNRLVEEINSALQDISVLDRNIRVLHRNLDPGMKSASGKVEANAEQTKAVSDALQELSEQYFSFKTLSTASKNLSQYTDEYYTKFAYYNNLRRITLGYVIGLDTNFVSGERMRKMVEEVYLQNTEYWLAYATMAVMLWASNEKEAAERAVGKALFIQPAKASLYFMLMNLRFDRIAPAKEWFLYYMERIDAGNLGEEWQYLLQAYLVGSFGSDKEFEASVEQNFKSMLAKAEAMTVDFGKKFSDRSYQYAQTYLHRTSEGFSYLKQFCKDYEELLDLLSKAEKNEILAKLYDDLILEKDDTAEDIPQRIENVLYALINNYDGAELEVVKKIRYNEAIISAKGNVSDAQKKYEDEFGPENSRKTFAELLVSWAFTEDRNIVSLITRRFSIHFMKDWILKGYEKYVTDYRETEKLFYSFDIDGCEMTCGENDFEESEQEIQNFYAGNRFKNIFSDKKTLLYLLITVCGLLMLVIMGVQLSHGSFSKMALVTGILLVLVGAFLLWRHIADLQNILREKERLSIQKLRHCLTELGEWRTLYYKANAKYTDLEKAVNRFGDKNE